MTKLWLILYVGTNIGGTWGPLPYDMTECQRRATDRMNDIASVIRTGVAANGRIVPAQMREDLRKWQVTCEYHETRPQLTKE